DSRSLGCCAGRLLKVVDQIGGEVGTLGPLASVGFGGTWTADGRIVAGSLSRGMFAISAHGGSAAQLTSFDVEHGQGGQVFPAILPDGRHLLYLSVPSNSVWLASLDSPETTRLMSADSQVTYVAGHLLFLRRQTLFAQPFDV